MACIMCSGKLWRQLGYARGSRSTIVRQHVMPGVALGSWAAKVFTEAGNDLVLALETRTYLTLVFPFAKGPRFQSNFAAALTGALNDRAVQPAIVRMESSAVEFAPLVPLRNRELSNSLQHAQFFCEIEFSYHTELRIIQRNLNDLPHPNRDPCVPFEAINSLFGGSDARRLCIGH